MVFLCFPVFKETRTWSEAAHCLFDLFKRYSEKLLAIVRGVHSLGVKLRMKCSLQSRRVIAVNERMSIEPERNARVP